jgi:putative intracellular protease/amidase
MNIKRVEMSNETLALLIVLTSHAQLGETEDKTGFWLEEFTTPYYAFLDAGIEITLASPKGGQPPIDPRSLEDEFQTDSTKRFRADETLLQTLTNTKKLSDVQAEDYDAIFYPGGHGPLWDLVDNAHSIRLIESFWKHGKPVSAVCHAPVALLNAKDENSEFIIKNKNITGFSNDEEAAIELTSVVPLLLEDALQNNGGHYSKKDNFQSHVVVDGLLVTGQNPASSKGVAEAVIELMKANK